MNKNIKFLLCYKRDKGVFLCSKEVQNIKGKRSRRRTNSRSALNRRSKSFCLSISDFHWSFISTHKELFQITSADIIVLLQVLFLWK